MVMSSSNIGSLLVRKFDNYVGIVTETDLARIIMSEGLEPESTFFGNIMISPILSLDSHLPI